MCLPAELSIREAKYVLLVTPAFYDEVLFFFSCGLDLILEFWLILPVSGEVTIAKTIKFITIIEQLLVLRFDFSSCPWCFINKTYQIPKDTTALDKSNSLTRAWMNISSVCFSFTWVSSLGSSQCFHFRNRCRWHLNLAAMRIKLCIG